MISLKELNYIVVSPVNSDQSTEIVFCIWTPIKFATNVIGRVIFFMTHHISKWKHPVFYNYCHSNLFLRHRCATRLLVYTVGRFQTTIARCACLPALKCCITCHWVVTATSTEAWGENNTEYRWLSTPQGISDVSPD